MNSPDRVMLDLRRHEREQDEIYNTRQEVEAEATASVERLIKDADWWNIELEGLPFSRSVADCIARCMQNLDAACAGDRLSRDALLMALANLQRVARANAYDGEIEKRTA